MSVPLAINRVLKFDSELFYLGAVLRDLGQTERFMGQ